jgi:hypothetical protein
LSRGQSGCFLIESAEESVEDLLACDLSLRCRVVALAFEGGPELDRGDEERARFTDRLEVAVHLDGASTGAVAEHPTVHLPAELGRLRALGIGRQLTGGIVECLDLLRDGEVLVGDGAVGDPRANTCHGQRPVSKQGGDGLQGHAPVDGLGGQSVSQLVRGDPAESCLLGGLADRGLDAGGVDGAANQPVTSTQTDN